MVPVDQADDLQVRAGRPRNGDIAPLEVGMTDAETTKGRVPGDEWQRDTEVVVQILDVIRRRLLLVPVSFPPRVLERQQRSTEPLQTSLSLFGYSYEPAPVL